MSFAGSLFRLAKAEGMHRMGAVLCLLMLLCAPARATRGEDTVLNIVFDREWSGRVRVADGWAAVEVEGMYGEGLTAGAPALPIENRLIVLPEGAQAELLGWSQSGAEEYRLALPLRPMQPPSLKDGEPLPMPLQKDVYTQDRYWSYGDAVRLERLGLGAQGEVYRIVFSPAAYNPVTQTVRWSSQIEARVAVRTLNPTRPVRQQHQRMLVVSRPDYKQGLQPFVLWKRQEGYVVDELYVHTHLRDSVKAQMQPYFEGERPGYVLLVGDAEQLQAFVGTSRPEGIGTHPTDLPYVCPDGGYMPVAALGRWSVADTAQLATVVGKTLRYEQGIDLDTTVLQRVLLVAGMEGRTPAPTTTNGHVNYVAAEAKAMHPELDTLCYHNPASGSQCEEVLDDISVGVGLLSYTAHCSTAGWTSPSISNGQTDLTTENQPAVWVNNCCSSNDFGGTCFGEELLRKPVGGAVAVIGATNSTLWNEDYYWAVGPKYPFEMNPQYDSTRLGAFDRYLGRRPEVQTVGELLLAGNMAVTAFGSPYDRFYWEIYCLLGDPTLRPLVGVPQQAWVEATAAGVGQISATATPGATVTLVQDSALLAVGTARLADGDVEWRWLRPIDTGLVIVTVSGSMLLPATDTLHLGVQHVGRVVISHVETTDSSVCLRLHNYSDDTLRGVQLSLQQEGIAQPDGVTTIVAQSTTIDSLAPDEEREACVTYTVDQWGQSSEWTAVVEVSGAAPFTVSHAMTFEPPVVKWDIVDAMGASVQKFTIGESYTLVDSVDGPADHYAVRVSAMPQGWQLGEDFVLPDSTTHLRVETEVTLQGWSRRDTFYMNVGRYADDFEQGLGCLPWQMRGTLGWTLDSVRVHSGRHSLRSGAISGRQTSDAVLTLNMTHEDTLGFWMYVSSEPNYDRFIFTIDGSTKLDRSGTEMWHYYTYPLAAGSHTLRWRYIKDDTGDAGYDGAWIDGLVLPGTCLWDAPYGCPTDDTEQLGIADAGDVSWSVWPNPASVEVTIDGVQDVHATIYDVYGREVYAFEGHHATVSHLPSGIYLVALQSGAGLSFRRLTIAR